MVGRLRGGDPVLPSSPTAPLVPPAPLVRKNTFNSRVDMWTLVDSESSKSSLDSSSETSAASGYRVNTAGREKYSLISLSDPDPGPGSSSSSSSVASSRPPLIPQASTEQIIQVKCCCEAVQIVVLAGSSKPREVFRHLAPGPRLGLQLRLQLCLQLQASHSYSGARGLSDHTGE